MTEANGHDVDPFDGLATETAKPCRVGVKHPDGSGAIVGDDDQEDYFEVYSLDSSRAKRWAKKILASHERSQKRGQTPSFEDREAETNAYLADMLTGWRISRNLAGDPISFPYSPERARQLLIHPGMSWLKAQIVEAIGDRSHFLRLAGESVNSSSPSLSTASNSKSEVSTVAPNGST